MTLWSASTRTRLSDHPRVSRVKPPHRTFGVSSRYPSTTGSDSANSSRSTMTDSPAKPPHIRQHLTHDENAEGIRYLTYRVVQWTTGNVGKSSVKAIASNPMLELVGCYAWSPDKVGHDVGELCGLEPLNVKATN